MHHSHPYFAGINDAKLPSITEAILKHGDQGVTLFFLMSAYTLCLSLNKKKETEIRPIRNYFMRRIFRIVPLYYCAILGILLANINSPSAVSVTANLLFVHGTSPYWINSTVPGGWSVGIEVLFYLLFPFLLLRIKSVSTALNFTLFFLILAKIVTSLMFKNPLINDNLTWGIFTYENIISQLPVFLTGICLYFISNHKKDGREQTQFYKSCFFIAVLLLLHMSGGNIFKDHYLFAIAFAFLAYGLSRVPTPVLVNSVTIWVGKLSYSIYLVHLIVANLLVKYNLNHYSSNASADVIFRFMIIFIVSISISWFTYAFIELPFQRWGKRIITDLETADSLKLETSGINYTSDSQ
jgi:peptidoglycan/LPS O-acetylase OafA/YrhL